ncbi:uncharacterized protein LOC127738724 [Mytilus californianus]|uniref:uncharacterized protein LOC127738724 n=1 Tax=Mytilus californianus TaxID=6549 RepID=UPI002247A681|nr:uncharacterized protein LOC127738724 [Mytilus californianus]
MSGTENTESTEEQSCDICKISYVTEKELQDHEWSLMHHIKIEQRKKGAVHKCSLCFTISPNLIEYGKHLNGDKHKQAIEESRVQIETLDPQEIQSRLHSSEKDDDPHSETDRMETSYGRDTRGHQRSYSQPAARGQFFGNRRPYRNRHGQFYEKGYNYQDSMENPYWHKSGMMQMFPYQWRQPWDSTSPDPWEHPNQTPDDMEFQYQDKNRNRRPSHQESNEQYSGRERYNRYEYVRPERDQDVDKRRIDVDDNRKSVRFEDESEETSGYLSQPQVSQDFITSKRRKRCSDIPEKEHPVGGRTTKNSKSRSQESPVVEADSTTDIEMSTKRSSVDKDRKHDVKKKPEAKVKKKKASGSKTSPRSDEGDTVLERAEKLCKELRDRREKAKKDVQKGKKVEKNEEINKQLAKFAEINKSYVKGVLDDTDLDVPLKLIDMRSKKSDKISSTTPKKENVSENSSSSVKEITPVSSTTKSKNKKPVSKVESPSRSSGNKVKDVSPRKIIDIHSIESPDESQIEKSSQKKSTSQSISRAGKTKVTSKTRDIDEIRKEIELEVRQSQQDKTNKSLINEESLTLHEGEEDESAMSEKNIGLRETDSAEPSKLRSSVESTSRESLLKMVNSPRSRKERQQLAEFLRTYAKSQNRLSLPRFNLQMSGLYDNLEHYGEFGLEELSPEVQLQIAELIEADIKPDIDELEQNLLLSNIKVESADDYPGISSQLSTSVDKLELLDKSLNQWEKSKAGFSDIESMNELNRLKTKILSSSEIKKEPASAVKSPDRSSCPQSPQYSQEEREFIEKFCSPGSPVKHVSSPQKHTGRADISRESRVSTPQKHVGKTDIPSDSQVSSPLTHAGKADIQRDSEASSPQKHAHRADILKDSQFSSPQKHDHSTDFLRDSPVSSPHAHRADIPRKSQDDSFRHRVKTEMPFITDSQEKTFISDAHVDHKEKSNQTKASDVLGPIKTSITNFRSRSNSLSSLHTTKDFNFSDSLRSNPETNTKLESVTSIDPLELWRKEQAREKISEKPEKLDHLQLKSNEYKHIQSTVTNLSSSGRQDDDKIAVSPYKLSDGGLASYRGSIESNVVSSVSQNKTSQSEPSLTVTGSLPWNNRELLPHSQIKSDNMTQSGTSWFDGVSLGQQTYHTESGHESVGEKILVAPSVSTWLGSGIPKTEPFCTVGTVALTSTTTVTTWSTSSGYLTQPQVMSSSDMSLPTISRDVRMRRPSETSTAESLVDTVYDISIKEEDTRQELQDVDQNITRLRKLIEESTEELNRYQERKQKLKKDEENLRSRRINVLQEARDKQKRPDSRHDSDISDRPTPPLSATEDSGITSGGRVVPMSSAENSWLGQSSRSGPEYQFGNPIGQIEPHILKGLQVLNSIQQNNEKDKNEIPSYGQRSFDSTLSYNQPSDLPPISTHTSLQHIPPHLMESSHQQLRSINTADIRQQMLSNVSTQQMSLYASSQQMPPNVSLQNIPPNVSLQHTPINVSSQHMPPNISQQQMPPNVLNQQHMMLPPRSIQSVHSSQFQGASISPVRIGSNVAMPSVHTLSPHSQMSPGQQQIIDKSKEITQIKVSDILYEGADMSSAANMEKTSRYGSLQEQISDNEKQINLSTTSSKTINERVLDQQRILNSSYDKQLLSSEKNLERDQVYSEKILNNPSSERQSEDVIMMSDDQKHGSDIIVINDSPKRSVQDEYSEKPHKKSWLAAEKPDSEYHPSRSKSPEWDEAQSHSRTQPLGTQSPVALKHRKVDDDVVKHLQSPLRPTPTKDQNLSNRQAGQIEIEGEKKNSESNQTTYLKSFGFVTLSNLMNTDQTKSPQNTPVNSPRREEVKKIHKHEVETSPKTFSGNDELRITKQDEEPKGERISSHMEEYTSLSKGSDVGSSRNDGKGSDVEKSDVMRQIYDNREKVNIQYMGSLSQGMDQAELLKQFKSGKGKDDGMSFLLVDGDQNKDMYNKLQLLFNKPPSGSSRSNKEEIRMETDDRSDSGVRDHDSNFESIGSNNSLGEKIRLYCKQNKPDVSELLITVSDGEQREGADCSVVSPVPEKLEERRCSSPYKKRLKTKKERDRVSIRKQKEGCILDSSSDYNSQDEDAPHKHGHRPKSAQKSRHSDVEIISDNKDDIMFFDKKSEDLRSNEKGSEVIPHRLLEEVQLETESDDSRAQFKDKFSERFKLNPNLLASLKAAVRSSLSKEECRDIRLDDRRRFTGPQQQVSGIQIVGDEIYVSYLGNSVRKFNFKTGELLHAFDCSPHQISCMFVLRTNDSLRLYTGGPSQHLLGFNANTGQLFRTENLEEKLQCFHHNWGKLFIGTYTGSILVWSTKTDRNIDAYVCSDRPISCISSATEGAQKVILVAAYDSTVFVLSATSGLLIRILEGHTKTVFSLQVDGSIVFSGSGDKTVMEHNLQTGDMSWTYTQAAGIITTVCVYEDLLFSASFDKFIRCYTRQDHKLKALYYGADRGLVTQMTVIDDKIITGNRNGIVEVTPVNRDKETMCQFEGCCHIFGIKPHLLSHVMSDHVTPDTKMFRCLWRGCKDWLSTKEGLQEAEEHMKLHIFT